MDIAWLVNQMDVRKSKSLYPRRPWMDSGNGAAAVPAGNIGLKGIIAGKCKIPVKLFVVFTFAHFKFSKIGIKVIIY